MYDFSSDDEGRLVVEENRPTVVSTLPSISSFSKKPKKIQSSPRAGLKLRLSSKSVRQRTELRVDEQNTPL